MTLGWSIQNIRYENCQRRELVLARFRRYHADMHLGSSSILPGTLSALRRDSDNPIFLITNRLGPRSGTRT
jgi:hypothetical protein